MTNKQQLIENYGMKALKIAVFVLAIFILNTTANAQTALEQQCANDLQGKVAWNKAGNVNWSITSINSLCRGTTNPSATISCFQNEIRTHDDWGRGITACQAQTLNKNNKERLVQVLYVIPKNQTAKPDANQAIAAIMTIIQRHFHEQLGVTFGLKDPLVTTVNIPEDAATIVDWNNNAKMIKSRAAEGYVNNQNVVVSIIEGSKGDMGGAWNIVKITGEIFWNEAYKTYKENPNALPTKLHGWSHELGHAFGLMHTSDAKPCFAKNGVDLGNLPSLIMQKSDDLGTVYNYPFLAQEKKLLLDESYLPDCRPFLNEPAANNSPARPHASKHLRYSALASAPKPTVVAPVTAANTATGKRYIKFSHEAGYVAEMTIMYHVNQNTGGVLIPIPKVEKTGNMTAGFSKQIEIPNNISPNMPIMVSIRGVGTTKDDFFSVNVPTNFTGELCYKAFGLFNGPKADKCN